MLRTRHEILSMLSSSAYKTGVSILNDGPGHRLRIHYRRGDVDRAYDCVVLVRSSDWYEYRLNVYAQLEGVEMVVCAVHDSCLPVPCWEVQEAKEYRAGVTKQPLSNLADRNIRGSKYGHRLFIAALLTARPEALNLLNAKSFPASTRRRIKAEVRKYANLRPGGRLRVSAYVPTLARLIKVADKRYPGAWKSFHSFLVKQGLPKDANTWTEEQRRLAYETLKGVS